MAMMSYIIMNNDYPENVDINIEIKSNKEEGVPIDACRYDEADARNRKKKRFIDWLRLQWTNIKRYYSLLCKWSATHVIEDEAQSYIRDNCTNIIKYHTHPFLYSKVLHQSIFSILEQVQDTFQQETQIIQCNTVNYSIFVVCQCYERWNDRYGTLCLMLESTNDLAILHIAQRLPKNFLKLLEWIIVTSKSEITPLKIGLLFFKTSLIFTL